MLKNLQNQGLLLTIIDNGVLHTIQSMDASRICFFVIAKMQMKEGNKKDIHLEESLRTLKMLIFPATFEDLPIVKNVLFANL